MPMGLVVIEVCEGNHFASLPLEELETKYFEVAVLRTDCLSMCYLCRAVPYAMVNTQRVYAKTNDQCINLVEEAVAREIQNLG